MDCAVCHGETGDGKTDLGKDLGVTSDFTSGKALESLTDQQIFDLIRKGKDKMPGEDADRAKDAEVKALILYLRNFSKRAPTPVEAPAAAPAPAASSPTSR